MLIFIFMGFSFWLICFAYWLKNKRTKFNKYIENHKIQLDNKKKYYDYLKWCEIYNSNINNKPIYPVDEEKWKLETDKENYINNILNN